MKNYSRPSGLLGLLGMICLLIPAAACVSSPVLPRLNPAWSFSDLRLLDPPDAPTPSTDILAVYTRTNLWSVEIRVDLLDINPGDQYVLKLAVWDERDFSQQPLSIDISSSGQARTGGQPAGGPVIWPRVVQDFSLDTITVSINRSFISEKFRVDVATYTTGPEMLADEAHNLRSDARLSGEPAPLLLAFWNTYPATTPTLALRRWAGAHTGPLGGRHGLKYILDGAGTYQVPVALLDLKNPASLAALDFMGMIPRIKNMLAQGLLILPDEAYSQPAGVALDTSRRAVAGFGLSSSQFVYAPSSDPSSFTTIPGYHLSFARLADSTHMGITGGRRLIPLPSGEALEATAGGPSLDVRRSLVATALSPDPADLVVLGGDLPNSTWGDTEMAGPTFAWIAAHPWIKPLAGRDLLNFPAQALPLPPAPTTANPAWLDELRAAPDNAATRSAWETTLTLSAPTQDAKLAALQTAYLGQVGELLAAAHWANSPAPRIDCREDLNADGQPECILADRQYFAVLETAGARLTQFFFLDANGPHQWIGPSSQFAVGLSDSSEWNPGLGEAADPGVIPGAFTDDSQTWAEYASSLLPDGISFTSPDGSRVKTYRLNGNGISCSVSDPGIGQHPHPDSRGSPGFLRRPNRLPGQPGSGCVDVESGGRQRRAGAHRCKPVCPGLYFSAAVSSPSRRSQLWLPPRRLSAFPDLPGNH